MEQKNLLLAIILSAIIMVGFQWYNSTQRPLELEETVVQKPNSNLPNLPVPSKSVSKNNTISQSNSNLPRII